MAWSVEGEGLVAKGQSANILEKLGPKTKPSPSPSISSPLQDEATEAAIRRFLTAGGRTLPKPSPSPSPAKKGAK